MFQDLEIYCDFDGTITIGDVTDFLLEKLALPFWQDIEALWEKGEIGSRQCMALQIPLIQGGWKAIVEQLSYVQLDPSFTDFIYWCQQENLPVHIVSDGIDKVIHYLLLREGIKVNSIWANHLHESSDGSLSLTFPRLQVASTCPAGICKCQLVKPGDSSKRSVIIGDGRSDFCWSAKADVLFAKSKLLNYCQQNKIACIPFENFNSIMCVLEEELSLSRPVIPQLYPALVSATA